MNPNAGWLDYIKRQAMEYLLPQAMTVTDKNLAKENLLVLSRLVEQVACYQLFLRQDLFFSLSPEAYYLPRETINGFS